MITTGPTSGQHRPAADPKDRVGADESPADWLAHGELEPVGNAGSVHPHGEVEVAGGHELIPYNPDAPSENWGWHGHWSDFAPMGRSIMLGVGIVGLLLMIFGNHVSHVEDWWLAALAIILLVWTVRSQRARSKARRLKP